jgi:tetratricopeptide (TPR) repeat protein
MSQPSPSIPASASRSRRRWLVGGAAAAAGGALLLGLWLWPRAAAPAPVLPDLADVDPEVVEAITEAHRNVQNHPASGAAWGKLGMVLRAHDYYREAAPCFAEAERLQPKDPRWPYLLGMCLVVYDPDSTLPCWERAVERCRRDDPLAVRLRLAEALLERGRLDEAGGHLQQVLDLEPDNLRARLGLGRLAVLRDSWPQALELLAPCSRDAHAHKQALRLLAQVRYRLGDRPGGDKDQAAAEEPPEDEPWPDKYVDDCGKLQRGLHARIQEAVDLMQKRRMREAIALLRETADRYPRAVKVQTWLGECWLRQDRPAEAEACYRQAVAIDPGAVQAWFWLGQIQAHDRPRDAADSLRRAIGLKPDYTQAHLALGQCLQKLGDRPGAAEAFRAALGCDPGCTEAREALKQLQQPPGGK